MRMQKPRGTRKIQQFQPIRKPTWFAISITDGLISQSGWWHTWVAFFCFPSFGCKKIDKVGTPQDRLCPRRRLPCRRRRLRRHRCRPVEPTPRRLCVDTRWQQLELIHFALVGYDICGLWFLLTSCHNRKQKNQVPGNIDIFVPKFQPMCLSAYCNDPQLTFSPFCLPFQQGPLYSRTFFKPCHAFCFCLFSGMLGIQCMVDLQHTDSGQWCVHISGMWPFGL
jgi:hypothetical protein